MKQPKDHISNRGVVESILRRIPGFRGYLEKEYRRDADRLQRDWLADRLQRSKAGLERLSRRLLEGGQLNEMPRIDRLRGRVDTQIARIRGAVQGYSGFFDLVQVDEKVLDRVYSHDESMMSLVEDLAEGIEAAPSDPRPPAELAAALEKKIDELQREWQLREEILRGLE